MLVKNRLIQDIYFLTRKKDIESLEKIGREVQDALEFLKPEEKKNERSSNTRSGAGRSSRKQ